MGAGAFVLGGVEVAMGAPKKEVLAELEARFRLEELRTDLYRVLEDVHPEATTGNQAGQAEKEGAMLGMVKFRDDRVVWASRDIGAFEGPAVRKFGRALFETIAAQNDEDSEPIKISTVVTSNQAFALSSITLEFPGRTIVVYVSYHDAIIDASIEEILVPTEEKKTDADHRSGLSGDDQVSRPLGASEPDVAEAGLLE
jgi:hypothetical protein